MLIAVGRVDSQN